MSCQQGRADYVARASHLLFAAFCCSDFDLMLMMMFRMRMLIVMRMLMLKVIMINIVCRVIRISFFMITAEMLMRLRMRVLQNHMIIKLVLRISFLLHLIWI